MKKIVALFLAMLLMFSLLPTAFAASDEAMDAANHLFSYGLFTGTGPNADGSPNFDLDRAPTRHEAITMLVNLLGKSEEATRGVWTTPFTDVADWAKPYVGYAYTNGLTSGTSATTFGGDDLITASQYLTFVLTSLGYKSGTDFQWDKAWELSDQIGLTDGRYNANTGTFLRGDLAIISDDALPQKLKGSSKTLQETLGVKEPDPDSLHLLVGQLDLEPGSGFRSPTKVLGDIDVCTVTLGGVPMRGYTAVCDNPNVGACVVGTDGSLELIALGAGSCTITVSCASITAKFHWEIGSVTAPPDVPPQIPTDWTPYTATPEWLAHAKTLNVADYGMPSAIGNTTISYDDAKALLGADPELIAEKVKTVGDVLQYMIVSRFGYNAPDAYTPWYGYWGFDAPGDVQLKQNYGCCCAGYANAVSYLLQGDYEKVGTLRWIGGGNHTISWVYTGGKYYVFDFVDYRNGGNYADFNVPVFILDKLEDFYDAIVTYNSDYPRDEMVIVVAFEAGEAAYPSHWEDSPRFTGLTFPKEAEGKITLIYQADPTYGVNYRDIFTKIPGWTN